MSHYPELPPGYAYVQENKRIYISDPSSLMRRFIYVPNACKYQYWHQHVNAALAAWKHAYEQLKEGGR